MQGRTGAPAQQPPEILAARHERPEQEPHDRELRELLGGCTLVAEAVVDLQLCDFHTEVVANLLWRNLVVLFEEWTGNRILLEVLVNPSILDVLSEHRQKVEVSGLRIGW
ncbi:hypothetical protein PNQ92_01915 [Halobacterium salinarum]|nr:hypothetical protein [Halobacterium salinarum]MDL0124165.1 hypothetical protein [Halobacterium salinarum]UEB93136.1 hypothetical protein LJ422_00185 [Halobacterium salinarum NRC-34001]